MVFQSWICASPGETDLMVVVKVIIFRNAVEHLKSFVLFLLSLFVSELTRVLLLQYSKKAKFRSYSVIDE